MENQVSTDVGDSLRNILLAYKNETGENTSSLAKKLGISQPSLSRIENKQKKATLSEQIKILIGTGNTSMALEAMGEMADEIKKHYLETEGQYKNTFIPAKKTLAALNNENNFLVMLLCLGEGIEESRLKDYLGFLGINTAEKMVAQGIIQKKNGKYLNTDGKSVVFDPTTLRNLLKNSISNCYKEDKFGTGRNYISFQKYSANRERAESLIYTKLKKCNKEIMDELDKPEYQGTHQMFFGMIFDELTPSVKEEQ